MTGALLAALLLAQVPPPEIQHLPLADLKEKEIRDTFTEGRSEGRTHEAIDLLAPRGTPVHAVVDGTIEKLFFSRYGGITIYQFDAQRQYAYYYAHLDRYPEGLAEKQRVKAGDVIGYVGTTGNAPPGTPHLHFTIFRLGPEKQWWKGDAVNPYSLLVDVARRGPARPRWVWLWHNSIRQWLSTIALMGNPWRPFWPWMAAASA